MNEVPSPEGRGKPAKQSAPTMQTSTDQNDQAIARLRLSKQKAKKGMEHASTEAGVWWALNMAEYAQLERLSRWMKTCESHYWQILPQHSFHSIAKVMDEDDPDSIDEEIRTRYGDDIDDATWLDGFITAALEKYDELAKQAGDL